MTPKIIPYEKLFEMDAAIQPLTETLARLLKKREISFCFIGGATLPHHNYARATTNIDILIDSKDYDKIQEFAKMWLLPRVLGAKRKFLWKENSIPITFVYSGEILGDKISGLPLEIPNKILEIDTKGIPYISLQKLIEYKLSLWKYGIAKWKDAGDAQELILRNKLPINYADKFRPDIKEAYLEIWGEPREETDESIF